MSKLWTSPVGGKSSSHNGKDANRTSRPAGSLTDQHQTIINAKLIGSLAIEEGESETSLVLRGQLEGDLTCDSIAIVESGSMEGTLKANFVNVSGKFSGSVDTEHLTIKPGAVVTGELRVRRAVVIEPGAHFNGNLASSEEGEEPSKPVGDRKKKANGDDTSAKQPLAEA